MITAYTSPQLSMALKELKKLIVKNEENGRQTVIFCEDRLTLAAERTVCQAVGGTFSTYVYTFARFLSAEKGKPEHLLSSQGSAMAIRKIIDDNRDKLSLFKRLSTATAAQDVYDTIALLYSSRVSAEDLYNTKTNSPLLARKIADLALLYSEYSNYLAESGWIDRNSYLKILPNVIVNSDKIKNSDVVFLGFQSFTCSVAECACACMEAAKNVYGFFIGGKEDFYTNEALASFSGQANKFGGVVNVNIPSELCPEAETLRQNIFNPACFYTATPLPTNKVKIFEGADEQEEMEYIAANIVKHVSEGVRYQSISVMLPDVKQYQGTLERVFFEYNIPFYADRRYSLSEHPICEFLTSYLDCAINGCTQESVSTVVTSPMFPANRKDKDIFINYILRLAAFRGGVKREPNKDILTAVNMDIFAVERIRQPFLEGLKLLPQRARGEDFCAALRELITVFNCEQTTQKLAEDFKDDYPSLSALSARATESTLDVLDEAEKLTQGLVMSARDFSKILKSGFCAMEISLIPPKQDAVFVGDLDDTANIGTQILFAAGLTDGVPACSQDTAILTDRELSSLEKLNLFISPKITQVNMRARELTALNISAFREHLYLTYPLKSGGEETCASEIISYAQKLFTTEGGGKLKPENMRVLDRTGELGNYFASRPLPAVRQLVKGGADSRRASSLYALLREKGYEKLADDAMALSKKESDISCGKALYGDFISPTTLESYFSCPYKSFMRQGLRLFEREEGTLRPLDSGNFIHTVLQKLAYTINDIQTVEALENSARAIAEELLLTPKYASINSNKRGEYTAEALKDEAVEVSKALYEQLKNSNFKVSAVEKATNVILSDGLRMYGRIDRVDECGEMVRIIDYKTGSIDSSASSYYMGLKLQLPLYLLSASSGKRAVGAYYFPAQLEYGEDKDGAFRMKGFMDSDEDVVKNSDTTLKEKEKSNYFDAYLKGRKIESAMPKEDFADFLQYAALIARKGSAELVGGYVAPSPAEGACKSCKLAGCCGFALGDGGEERKSLKVNCGGIAKIVRKERGDEE